MIAIVNYDIGNIRSILGALEQLKVKVVLTRDPSIILKADGLILPGVGAFSTAMDSLKKYDLLGVLKNYANSGKPMFGICLGMQILMDESEEFGFSKGLSLISGKVIKFPCRAGQDIRLPHIGWNCIKEPNIDKWKNTILDGIKDNSDVYFVHSYIISINDPDVILSKTVYEGVEFCSALQKNNIFACQFHPEKSGAIGLSIYKNFVNLAERGIYYAK